MSSKGVKRKATTASNEQLTVKVKQEPLSEDFATAVRESRTNVASSVADFVFNKKRVRILSECQDVADNCRSVLYWMSRDCRVEDNWALLYAQKMSLKFNVPLHICFSIVPQFLGATQRQYNFLIRGLQEVERDCHALNIPFHMLIGEASKTIPQFVATYKTGVVVTDISPLKICKRWMQDLKPKLPSNVPLCHVDAHNIVPVWVTSDKQEYAARTIRKKIHDKLPEFLTFFPPVLKSPFKSTLESNDWEAVFDSIKVDKTVFDVEWASPGTEAGLQVLSEFIRTRLKGYSTLRNDPTHDNLSKLSPWFHFGHISVQRAVLEVRKQRSSYKESVDAFIEEAIVRRELSDNFCYYNDNYDNLNGITDWAQKTLEKHRNDKREHLYSQEQFEKAQTSDPLWNAAQRQMVIEGKMHGFLRMYWAKKILEWTQSPEEALRIAIYLNDKYNLDGRDPNGYVGCLWSIGGIHDRPWKERPVFGYIRYMNYEGCKRKFDVKLFEKKYK